MFQSVTTGSGNTPIYGTFTFETEFECRYPKDSVNLAASLGRKRDVIVRFHEQRAHLLNIDEVKTSLGRVLAPVQGVPAEQAEEAKLPPGGGTISCGAVVEQTPRATRVPHLVVEIPGHFEASKPVDAKSSQVPKVAEKQPSWVWLGRQPAL